MDIKNFLLGLKKDNRDVALNGQDLELQFDGDVIEEHILQQLQKNKAEIVSYLNKISGSNNASNLSIPLLELQPSYKLSSSQLRMWILSHLEEDGRAYNMPGVYRFSGKIDVEELEASFIKLISRHEILRTVFKEDAQGQVCQYIQSVAEHGFKLNYVDYSTLSDQAEKVHLYIQDIEKSFDLSQGPLLRAALIQTGKDEYIFSYVMHHIISDGWSMSILIKELLLIYNSKINSEPFPLSPLRIQYKDYAAWQQAGLKQEKGQQAKAYWQKQFSDEIPLLEMPTDHARGAVKSYNGRLYQKPLDSNLIAGFLPILHQEGATMFMGLLGLINTLLYKYSDQSDIIIGSPIAGREHIDLEEQIGFYANTLALRTQFSGQDSYRKLLQTIKSNTLSAYQHQMYPFDELVAELDLRRDMSRNPLFDVMLVLLNNEVSGTQSGGQSLGDIKISSYEGGEIVASKFDLTFTFTEIGDTFYLSIEYNNDLYERRTIERLCTHLESLLLCVVKDADKSLNVLDYISASEKQELLETFNATEASYPKEKSLVDLFEEQVKLYEENIALVFNESTLSYKALNERSNQLAGYLKSTYKIKADDLIGIKLERSEEMIVSILGILKSGGAYVPIDPDYPQERIDYILQDSKCKVLIDEAELNKFNTVKSGYSTENKKSAVKPTDLAYVIYTSGTTGKPKGVMVEHRQLLNLCYWHNTNFSVTAQDRSSIYAGVGFDAMVWELFPYLIKGSSLYIIPKEIRLDVEALNNYYKEKSITISFLPTQIAEQFYSMDNESLRYLLVGGDRLKEYADQKYTIVNNYGPTENTVVTTSIKLSSQIKSTTIPIGRPISNTEVYILDERMRMQPLGVIGELCISGAGLARGYINNKELTEEKFVAHPYAEGKKIYRTGDLARWLSDGNIEFIGRKDDQVKIRGYRIELGEIESVLLGMEKIDQAVVLARELSTSGKELIAYVVSENEMNLSDIRSQLAKELPSYMIPAYYVQMDKFPLTANGKLNKKALPHPQGSNIASGVKYVAPTNETEEKLVAIWSEVLGIQKDKIGIQDDFFTLGGHSLKAVTVLLRIERLFLIKLKITDLFINPTIENISNILKAKSWVEKSKVSDKQDRNIFEI
jgi:amino acid adenylation domain-containing protein